MKTQMVVTDVKNLRQLDGRRVYAVRGTSRVMDDLGFKIEDVTLILYDDPMFGILPDNGGGRPVRPSDTLTLDIQITGGLSRRTQEEK